MCGYDGPEQTSVFQHFRVRARPLALEAEWQLDDADVAAAWRCLSRESLDAVSPDALYAAMETIVEELGRWPRVRTPILSSAHRTETRVAMILRAWSALPPSASNFFPKARCTARLAKLRQRMGTAGNGAWEPAEDGVSEHVVDGASEHAEHGASEDTQMAWSYHTQQALRRLGLAALPVSAEEVFHHEPAKALSLRQQKEKLEKVGVYHALEVGWERTSDGGNMFVPRSYLAATNLKALSLDARDVIRLHAEDSDTDDDDPEDKKPWAQLFIFHSSFREYNEERLLEEDPQGHRWCSDKQLFDYTPFVTREDWVRRFLQQRRIERKHNAASSQRAGAPEHAWVEPAIWRPLLGDAPVLRDKPMSATALVKAAIASTGLQDEYESAPYDEFLKSDWENHCWFWEPAYQSADVFRDGKTVWEAWRTRCSSPSSLRWLGGTYARSPKDFPAAQQSIDWVHSRLRPLGLQPSEVLLRLRKVGDRHPFLNCVRKATTLSDEVRSAKLHKHLSRCRMPGVWYALDNSKMAPDLMRLNKKSDWDCIRLIDGHYPQNCPALYATWREGGWERVAAAAQPAAARSPDPPWYDRSADTATCKPVPASAAARLAALHGYNRERLPEREDDFDPTTELGVDRLEHIADPDRYMKPFWANWPGFCWSSCQTNR